MGYYIETDSLIGKARIIADLYGGEVIPRPKSYDAIPEGKAVIVIIHNAMFEAAAFAYNEHEYAAFHEPDEWRYRDYVLMDRDKAEELSGYKRAKTRQ